MADSDDSDGPTLTGALVTLGGIAGFLWGGTVGSEDPDSGFWAGAIVGTFMGLVGGFWVGRFLSAVFQVVFALLSLALTILRIYLRFSSIGY